jgi:Arm DNA-binding domain
MARAIGKLTALAVDRARRRGYYGDGGGLFLQVSATGAKSWVFRFKEAGRLHEMGLGPVHTIGLAEARERARECRRMRLDGLDPIEARKATRMQGRLDAAKAMTFAACAERYIASHKAGWRNPKHAAQWPATLAAYVDPIFGALPVQAVDVGLVMRAVEPIWTVKPETAAECAAASRRSSIGRRRAAIGKATTLRGGAAISKTFCQGAARSAVSSIMRRFPIPRSAPS